MSKVKVGMVQINNSFSNQNYFPYSVGMIQAFTKRHLKEQGNLEFLLPIHTRIPVKSAVERLIEADIVCFSTYVWNIKISLKIAEEIKKNKPEVVTVFGGPQIPGRETESFLRLNPFIDIACQGEGEIVLQSILENYPERNWRKVSSVNYIDEDGRFIKTSGCERISDVNQIPSPYLEGVFDPLVTVNPNIKWVALWETNRGCPFSCSYCDWGSATKNKVYAYDIERLFREIDWFSKNKIEFIFCCDANFGILDRDIEIVRYLAENKTKYGYPKAFSVQSTKNFTEHSYEIYKIMSDAGLNKGVSLSLQSLNKETLKETGRSNISIGAFKEIQQKLTAFNIETFTDLILGLASETYETFADGVSSVIENGQHNRIQFNNLSILPNAEMGNPEYQKKFDFNTVETKLINIHGSLSAATEVEETQQLVISTNAMPESDWVRTRVFGWMTALLHFDKLLQIPFVVLHKTYSVSFRELIEIFIDNNIASAVLSDIYSFFIDKAIGIQKGGAEFCESKEWLNIWWPADELILIELCAGDKLTKFYEDAEELIYRYLQKRDCCDCENILHASVVLNQNLIKLPFQEDDIDISLSYNIWDFYHAALRGVKTPLQKGDYRYAIDRASAKWSSWEEWCREVVWYGNKKGAYIYNVK